MIGLMGKQITSGSVQDLVDWLESHPNKGNKIVGVWAENVVDTLAAGRESGLRTEDVYPEGISRESYRLYSLGVIYGNAVNNGRVKAAIAVADRLQIPDDIEIEMFYPEKLWKGAGAKFSTYTVIHKPSGRLYFAGRPAEDANHNVKVLSEVWRNVATRQVVTVDQVQQYLKEQHRGHTTLEVAGVTVNVEKPPYRCQKLSGVKGVAYADTVFLVTDSAGCVAPIAA